MTATHDWRSPGDSSPLLAQAMGQVAAALDVLASVPVSGLSAQDKATGLVELGRLAARVSSAHLA